MKDEKILKRFLKKRCKITLALVTSFLITGSVAFAESINSNDVEYLLSLKGNFAKFENKKIDNVEFNINSENTPSEPNPDKPTNPDKPINPDKPEIPLTPIEPSEPIPEETVRPETNVITVNGKEQKDDKGFIGIYQTKEDITNSLNGAIISATGVGKATNIHTITNNGNSLQTGMEAVNDGTVINAGKIIIAGNGTGLYAENNGTIMNTEKGDIKANTGMMIYNSGKGENHGIITSDGFAVDMQDITSSSTFVNGDKGVLNGDIRITKLSAFENKGTINAKTLEVTNGAILNNYGIIKSTGELSLNTDSKDGDNRFTDGRIINEKGGTIEGTLIKVGRTDKNGGTINRGTIKGNIQGDVIDDGGSVISSSMKGNLYLTGNSVASYDKVAVNEKINIEKLDGEVYSKSALYEVKKEGNKVLMERNDFTDLVSDKNVAEYFENNFKAGDTLKNNLLDEIKNISSKKELEKATNNILGNSLIPNLKVQTKEMITFNHNSIQDVIKKDTEKDLRIIGGTNYGYKDTKPSNLTGYENSMYNVYFGADKEINSNLRAGGVFTVGRLNSDYDDNSEREDTFYQLEAFATYKYQDYKLMTSLVGGYADGELDRAVSVGNIKDKYNSDIKTYYAGTYNTLSKNYDFDNFYVEPNVKLNLLYLNQDDIKENGDYRIKVDKDDTFSVETGLGIAVGKDFELRNMRVNVETSANIYHEFAEPYDSLNAKLDVVSSDSYKISKYEREDLYGDFGVKLEIADLTDTITGFVEGKIIVDDKTNYESSIGITYKF